MAQSGYTPIKIYYSATPSSAPTAGNLAAGELAINAYDGKLFYKDSSNAVQTIATKSSAALVGSTSDVVSRGTSYGIGAGDVSTGTANTFLGYGAGADCTTGSYNTAVGENALPNITIGGENTAVGSVCLASVSTGTENTCVGSKSLINNNGYDNTAVGHSVMPSYSGDEATAVGAYALNKLTTGTGCTAVGYSAGTKINVGTDNTMLGYQSGSAVNTGSQNTVVGANAAYSGTNNLTTGSNNTIIGYNAAASAATVSNEITLGNSSIATLRCQVTTITSLSDARDKTNVVDLPAGLSFLKALRPVQFDWNTRDGAKSGITDTGFIAQDLQAAQEAAGVSIPGLVYSSDPERLEAGYGKLIAVLVKAVQELAAEVDRLKSQP